MQRSDCMIRVDDGRTAGDSYMCMFSTQTTDSEDEVVHDEITHGGERRKAKLFSPSTVSVSSSLNRQLQYYTEKHNAFRPDSSVYQIPSAGISVSTNLKIMQRTT